MRGVPMFVLALCLLGCGNDERPSVTLYTSVDVAYAQPIIDAFEAESGVAVRVVTDTEATKSVGLAERLRAEKDRPVADVWWGNEPFRTIRLADEDLFERYVPATADGVAPLYRDADARWHGTGIRARVLAVSADAGHVATLDDLTQDALRGRAVIARPTAGTTGSHVAALYVTLGETAFDDLFRRMRANDVALVAGNSYAAEAVATGSADAGLTDNDDVAAAQRNLGSDVQMVLLDQAADGIGTLTLPTTVALVRNTGSDQASAKSLIDFLIRAKTEQMLLDSGFTIGSVRDTAADDIRAMQVDYLEVADALPVAVERATALLEGRKP